MRIRDSEIEVDFLEELEEFDVWDRQRVRENKFQACSPFRTEKHPSFACNLDTGVWIDSGSDNEEWRKGGFVKLLAFLREEPMEDTMDYLLEKYSPFNLDIDNLKLDLDIKLEPEKKRIFTKEEINHLIQPTDYLRGRGITDEVQAQFMTGYDSKGKGVSLPWHNLSGEIVNIKYRSIKDKYFWYEEEGQMIKYNVYGLFLIKRMGYLVAYVVESEIDALYLWSLGFPAIALGRAGMSAAQRELILASGIQTLIIATDNDKAGWRAGLQIISELHGLINCMTIDFPNNIKDVNDMKPDVAERVCNSYRPIKLRII